MQGSDATVSLALLERVFPRAASETVAPFRVNYVLLYLRYYSSRFSVLSTFQKSNANNQLLLSSNSKDSVM